MVGLALSPMVAILVWLGLLGQPFWDRYLSPHKTCHRLKRFGAPCYMPTGSSFLGWERSFPTSFIWDPENWTQDILGIKARVQPVIYIPSESMCFSGEDLNPSLQSFLECVSYMAPAGHVLVHCHSFLACWLFQVVWGPYKRNLCKCQVPPLNMNRPVNNSHILKVD